jgi:tetratricopeptide (TPR) repeat protein
MKFRGVMQVLVLGMIFSMIAACDQPATSPSLETAIFNGNWQEIEATAKEWMQRVGFRREAAVILGYSTLAQGDAEAAVNHFLRARSDNWNSKDVKWAEDLAMRHPNVAVAQLLAGDALARHGNLNAALVRLDETLTIGPNLTVARLSRAMLRAMLNQRVAALHDINVLVADKAIAAEALVLRGLLCLEASEQEKALIDLNRALEVAPKHAIAYNARGLIYARLGDWITAARDFDTAFRLAPELREARHNWQLAHQAAERGAVLSARQDIGSITMVVADRGNMNVTTALASDALRGRTGQIPVVAANIGEAIALSRSYNVILQVPNGGLSSVGGDRMLGTLNTIGRMTGGTATVDIVTHGFGPADNATLGALRHMNTAPQMSQTRIGSLQMVDLSEASGLAGKTPLAVTNTGALALRAVEIQGRGIPVAAFPTEGKLGLQHMGNVKVFQDAGIPTYSAQWQGKGEFGLGLSPRPPFVSPSLGVSNAADSAGNRTNLGLRDWVYRGNGIEQHFAATLPDIMKQNMVGGSNTTNQRLQSPLLPGGSLAGPGGISVGLVSLARGVGGRVVFKTGDDAGADLALVYTLFSSGEINGKAKPGKN